MIPIDQTCPLDAKFELIAQMIAQLQRDVKSLMKYKSFSGSKGTNIKKYYRSMERYIIYF